MVLLHHHDRRRTFRLGRPPLGVTFFGLILTPPLYVLRRRTGFRRSPSDGIPFNLNFSTLYEFMFSFIECIMK